MTHADDTPVPAVSFRLTPADVAASLWYYRWGTPDRARARWLYQCWLLVAAVTLGDLIDIASRRRLGLGPWAIFLGILTLLTRVWDEGPGVWFEARHLYKLNPELGREVTATALPDGLEYQHEGDRTLHRWHGIAEVSEGKRHLFVVNEQNVAMPIPRRAFPSHAAAGQFLARCQEYVRRTTATEWPAGPMQVLAFGDQQMRVQFELTHPELDTLRGAAIRERVRQIYRQANTNTQVTAGLLIGLLMFGWALVMRRGPMSLLPAVLVTGGIIWFGVIYWARWGLRRWRQMEGRQEITIAPSAVSVVYPDLPPEIYSWRAIRAVDRSFGHVFFWGKVGLVVAVPDRMFASTAELEEFLRRAREWRAEHSPA
jgi:hypothetical protein